MTQFALFVVALGVLLVLFSPTRREANIQGRNFDAYLSYRRDLFNRLWRWVGYIQTLVLEPALAVFDLFLTHKGSTVLAVTALAMTTFNVLAPTFFGRKNGGPLYTKSLGVLMDIIAALPTVYAAYLAVVLLGILPRLLP